MRAQWVAATIVVAVLAGTAQVGSAQVVDEDRRLAKMAADAESVEQHARVAEQYRDRAEALDTQAARYERTARRLEKGWFPHEYKAASRCCGPGTGAPEGRQGAQRRRARRACSPSGTARSPSTCATRRVTGSRVPGTGSGYAIRAPGIGRDASPRRPPTGQRASYNPLAREGSLHAGPTAPRPVGARHALARRAVSVLVLAFSGLRHPDGAPAAVLG